MKALVKPNLSVLAKTVTVSVLMLAAHLAAAAGGGYGGPDIAAEVVPPSFNGISAEDLVSAMTTCLVMGDESRQIYSLNQRVYQLLNPHENYRPNLTAVLENSEKVPGPRADALKKMANDDVTLSKEHKFFVAAGGYLGIGQDWLNLSGNMFNDKHSTFYTNINGKDMSFSLVDANIPAGEIVPLTEWGAVIEVDFKDMHNIPTYDNYGNVSSQTLTFDGVVVKSTADVARFINELTNRTLTLTLSMKEAVSCMRTELQRAAK